MTTTAQLDITHLTANQGSPEVTLNQALNIIDAAVNLTVADRDLTTPPGSPSDGDRYIVGPSATGAWSGKAGQVAVYIDGWVFLDPQEGWMVFVQDENLQLVYNGSAWVGRYSVDYAVVASTTQTQAGATLLTAVLNYVGTIVADDDAVKLPPAYDGARCCIFNPSAYTVAVWPSSGDRINTLAVDAAHTLGTTRGNTFHGFDGHWCQM